MGRAEEKLDAWAEIGSVFVASLASVLVPVPVLVSVPIAECGPRPVPVPAPVPIPRGPGWAELRFKSGGVRPGARGVKSPAEEGLAWTLRRWWWWKTAVLGERGVWRGDEAWAGEGEEALEWRERAAAEAVADAS